MFLQNLKLDTRLTAAPARLQHPHREKQSVPEPTAVVQSTKVGWRADQQGAAPVQVGSRCSRFPLGHSASLGGSTHQATCAESEYYWMLQRYKWLIIFVWQMNIQCFLIFFCIQISGTLIFWGYSCSSRQGLSLSHLFSIIVSTMWQGTLLFYSFYRIWKV